MKFALFRKVASSAFQQPLERRLNAAQFRLPVHESKVPELRPSRLIPVWNLSPSHGSSSLRVAP